MAPLYFSIDTNGKRTSHYYSKYQSVPFTEGYVTSIEVVEGEDIRPFNLKQLKSGQYVGCSEKGYFCTLKSLEMGQLPQSFNYMAFTKATQAEVDEYLSL